MSEKSIKQAVRTQEDLKKPITDEQRRRLQAIASVPDEMVDLIDIPIASPDAWKTARRGLSASAMVSVAGRSIEAYTPAHELEERP